MVKSDKFSSLYHLFWFNTFHEYSVVLIQTSHSSLYLIFSHSLEKEGCFEKATAISLFHGRIDDALNILNRGAEYGEED